MKPDAHKHIEHYRFRGGGAWSSDESFGNNGAFNLPIYKAADSTISLCKYPENATCVLRIICSDGEGWDHVSVSLESRCPNWAEMCFVKDLFFDAEEAVMQLHPPRSAYVNHHPHCLHLWRPYNRSIPLPPTIFVGPLARTA